jgi:hypothetical protein
MKVQDWLTREGAEKLAAKLERYWKRRGYLGIRTSVEPFSAIPRSPPATQRPHVDGERFFQVRTNIGPLGFPPAA